LANYSDFSEIRKKRAYLKNNASILTMVKISLIIITFNEEENIERCIDSAEGLVDEIVVVDSFSTDQTQALCRKKNVRLIMNAFEGYIAQKNFALAQASHDWILSLDADEALSETLKGNLVGLKNQSSLLVQAYQMNRLTNYCGKWIRHTDWYPDKKIRFFDKNYARFGGKDPHDMVVLYPQAKFQHIKGDILHYSYHSISQHIGQLNRFTDIGAKVALEAGKRANIFVIFGSPIVKFFQSYVLRLGFLDGYYGFVVCAISAFARFTKYIKLKQLQARANNH
jgi:glycosyltransferase involved in cell wall biosynthesis